MDPPGDVLFTLTEVDASDSLHDVVERAGVKRWPLKWLIWSQRRHDVWRSRRGACRIILTLRRGRIGPVRRHSPVYVSVRAGVRGLGAGGGGVAVPVGQAVINRRQGVVLTCADVKRGRCAGIAGLEMRRVGLRRRAVFLATDTLLEFVEFRDVAGGVELLKCWKEKG